MRVLPLIFLVQVLILVMALGVDDSPHGSDFKLSCSLCHSPKGWELDREIYAFDHNSTGLPLEGQHTVVNCRACHPTLVFTDAGTECVNCHTDMHYQSVGLDCGRCHSPESWIVKDITELHRQSRFPLLGPHLLADCEDCHPSASLLRFEPLRIECIDCHREDYTSATNPNHVLGNISTDCLECHLMHAFSWSGSGFNHLFFPLTGGHAVDECTRCHTGSDYSDISSDCFSCHQADYNATSNPDHLAAGISTECLECHSTDPGWEPALFPGHDALFPLTDGHAGPECNDCHTGNNYQNLSPECYACHQADYNNTTNPDHLAAGIPTDCQECHTTLPGWKPAEFTMHDAQFFPIYSGAHRGKWDNCSDCHTNPANYAVFSCIDCHAHNRRDMDDEHSGEVQGYQYNSQACLQCHPSGSHE